MRLSLRSTTLSRSSWGLAEAHAETQRAALALTRLGCDTFVVVVTTPFSIVRSAYVSCGGAGASASNVCAASTVASPVMSSWLAALLDTSSPGTPAGHRPPSVRSTCRPSRLASVRTAWTAARQFASPYSCLSASTT